MEDAIAAIKKIAQGPLWAVPAKDEPPSRQTCCNVSNGGFEPKVLIRQNAANVWICRALEFLIDQSN